MVLGTEVAGPIGPAQRAAVEALLRERELTPRVRERLEMVKGAALGWDLAAIAAWCGRAEATVRRWLAAFHDGGVLALADAPGRPTPPTWRRWRRRSRPTRGRSGRASTSGPRPASAPTWPRRPGPGSRRGGCGCCSTAS